MEPSNYLRELGAQIRSPKARERVSEEMKNHIEDQAVFYEQDGMSHEEALSQAVEQMGDPVAVGIELDRIHRPKPAGRFLLLAVTTSYRIPR